VDEEGIVTWRLDPEPNGGWDPGYLVAYAFNYTCVSNDTKATFKYCGGSVKPSARTLRIYGAEVLQSVVRDLATNKDFNREGRDLIDELDLELFRFQRKNRELDGDVDDGDDNDGWG
jgi:hypothetical protein